jgi:hypothetical protein
MINPALLIRLRKFKLKQFVKRGGQIKKLKAQKTPKVKHDINLTKELSVQKQTIKSTFGKDMPKSFYIKPPIISGKQEIALKAARIREVNVLKSKVKTIRKATATRIKSGVKIFGKKSSAVKLFKKTTVFAGPRAKSVMTGIDAKGFSTYTKIPVTQPKVSIFKRTPFGKLVKAKTEQLTGRAVIISKKRGFIHGERTAKKLGVTFPKGLKEMKTQFAKQTKYWKRPSEKGSKIYRAKFGDPYTKGEKFTFARKQAKQEKIFSSGKGYFDPKSQSFKWRPKKKR